jgi:hypothetical protein
LNDQLKKNEMGKYVAHLGDRRDAYKVLVGRPEVKRPIGRPTCRWEDNIKMDLQEVGWGGMDWMDLAQERCSVVGTCECGNEHSGSIKCKEFPD